MTKIEMINRLLTIFKKSRDEDFNIFSIKANLVTLFNEFEKNIKKEVFKEFTKELKELKKLQLENLQRIQKLENRSR